jgi:hypothetical protein
MIYKMLPKAGFEPARRIVIGTNLNYVGVSEFHHFGVNKGQKVGRDE